MCGQQRQTSAQSVREDKQLDWLMSNWDSFKQSTDLAVTLWPKIWFLVPVQWEQSSMITIKAPLPIRHECDWSLVVNFCPCLHAKGLLHINHTKKNTEACGKKKKLKKSSLCYYYQRAYPLKAFLNIEEWDCAAGWQSKRNRDMSLHFPRERTLGSRLDRVCSAKQQPNLHLEN